MRKIILMLGMVLLAGHAAAQSMDEASVMDESVSAQSGGYRLPPDGKVRWDWQIGAPGDSAIGVPPGVRMLDVDGFNISAAKVTQLKQAGVYPVCYLDVGSFEPGRPDSDSYPASLKLQADPDWPGEYFLDVRDVFRSGSKLAAILNARFEMCRKKGFRAVEPDNLQNDENVRGGKITARQQVDFNGWVADAVHAHGMAVFQKNGPDKILSRDRTGRAMVDKFDGIINEQCQEFDECSALAEYARRGKPALDVEYKKGMTLQCAQMNVLGVSMMKKDLRLVGMRSGGYVRQACN